MQMFDPSAQPPSARPLNPFCGSYFPSEIPVALTPEAEPEPGYPPPDPAFYDYYASDPAMQAFAQAQQKPRFTFMRRINKMNWDFLDKIDVGTMARTGDVGSIEYLMQAIAFANVTTDDARFFGSRAALHAFLVLQMSVEVLLSKLANVPTAAPPPPGPVPGQITPQQAAQYDAKIELLTRDVKSRDLIITSLTERLRIAEQGRDEAYASIQSIQAKKMPPTYQRVDFQASEKPKKRVGRAPENTETGQDHLDTEYIDYLHNRPAKYLAKRRKKAGHHRQGQSRPTSSETHSETASCGWT
jgi:hypothetical protein